MKRYLEAGRLNSPRGLRGELRFDCWCDSIEFLEDVKFFYLDKDGSRPIEIKEYNTRLSTVIFVGYEDRTEASRLTGRTVYFDREEVPLPEGVYYNDDLIGLPVFDECGARLGTLSRIDEGVASDYYFVKGDRDYYIPAVDAFVVSKDINNGITVRNTDGLEA